MKISRALAREFFDLIRDEKRDTFSQCVAMIRKYPGLVNEVVRGMAKGIDGFSALMLAVRYYKFRFAIELVNAGADVNYVDSSAARQNYNPVFFDLLEMLKNLVEARDFEHAGLGIRLWDTMEVNGLDYSKRSVATDGLNKPESCLQAFIRIASSGYAHKHRVSNETRYEPPSLYEIIHMRSERNRDVEKERRYELMIDKIVNRIDEGLVRELNANHHRDSRNVFRTSPGTWELVDYFALELANEKVRQRFGFVINSIADPSFMDDYKDFADELHVERG